MMNKQILTIVLLSVSMGLSAQKYLTKAGKIHFLSTTPMEKIEGTSKTASSVYDSSTGNLEWAVLVKSFAFEKALMEDHFNENYMESSKFPKAKFKGKVSNASAINLKKDGNYTADISGSIEIHGVTKPVSTTATFTVKGGKIQANTKFEVKVADFNIEIPSLVKEKIAKTVIIDVSTDYTVYVQ